ncbi:hypothetical protein Cni_G00527 [Canna indica]|uniref:non-specific serine/threonine protein kinase n=1 Tax=Canna indica TaxID=4628 RepID=A0AAQ3JKZ7_9LILI|nr:hypothetical protein Cni_G00527 [Canna indica]
MTTKNELRVLCFLSTLLCSASALSFNLTSFGQDSPIRYEQDDARLNGSEIILTQYPMQYATGRIEYTEPLLLWDSATRELTDFTTRFSFVINSFNISDYGDGLAFFLAPYNTSRPQYSRGGLLGLFYNSSLTNLTVKAVAVEFDTFSNDWDPKGDHIGIDVNSIVSKMTAPWNSSVKEGRLATAWVSYDAKTHNLSVVVSYDSDHPVSSSLSFVVDLRDVLPERVAFGFSATTGNLTETHTLVSWSFSSSLQASVSTDGKKSAAGIAAGAVIGALALMAVFSGLIWFLLLRKKPPASTVIDDDAMDDQFERERGPKRFPYEELAAATRGFSEDGKLGEGGFGSVYRGKLNEVDVAIKRVSKEAKQGRKEYISEVTIISRLRHRNLVQLHGWCHNRGEFLLVYEFMPNGSLASHIYSPEKCLQWPARQKAALGLASALFYLHQECEPSVVHRDVKPSNVMLDSAFNAKLGDFGLARLLDEGRGLETTILAGTLPYMAPEYYHFGKASKESDVYSFGIVALEIACGRKPMEEVLLVEWVWELYGKGAVLEAADKRLNGEFEEKEMECLMVVGLWCAHPDCALRPSIQQAINVLNFEKPLPKLPPRRPRPIYHHPSFDMLAGSTSSNFVTASTSASTAASLETNLASIGCSTTSSTTKDSSVTSLSPASS